MVSMAFDLHYWLRFDIVTGEYCVLLGRKYLPPLPGVLLSVSVDNADPCVQTMCRNVLRRIQLTIVDDYPMDDGPHARTVAGFDRMTSFGAKYILNSLPGMMQGGYFEITNGFPPLGRPDWVNVCKGYLSWCPPTSDSGRPTLQYIYSTLLANKHRLISGNLDDNVQLVLFGVQDPSFFSKDIERDRLSSRGRHRNTVFLKVPAFLFCSAAKVGVSRHRANPQRKKARKPYPR
jgi:hypothetical protein